MAGFERALCVSIHDVSASTWPSCEKLINAIGQVAPVPLTLMVVPAWHHRGWGQRHDNYYAALEHQRNLGGELALHGYTHLDEGRRPDCPWTYFCREIYSRGEGEFAGLSMMQAQQRLKWGLEWFARHGWSADGFVAPAWLLSDGGWDALRGTSLRYTTTLSRFHLLQPRRSLFAPCLVHSARSGWASMLSRAGSHAGSRLLRNAPLVRLALRPGDAAFPATVLHCQRLLERLLHGRVAMTKSAFALRWAAVPDDGHALPPFWIGNRSA